MIHSVMSFCYFFAMEITGRSSVSEGAHSKVYSNTVSPFTAVGTSPVIPWKGTLKHHNLITTWKKNPKQNQKIYSS